MSKKAIYTKEEILKKLAGERSFEKILYEAEDMKMFDEHLDGVGDLIQISNAPYRLIRTTSTAKFIAPHKEVHIIPKAGDIGGYGAFFIRKVKDHFHSLPLPKPLSNDRPFYEYFKPISTYMVLDQVTEIDLNSAYWEAAYKLGYLPEDLYKEAYSDRVSKKARLIALGVLGKKTTTFEFEPPYRKPVSQEETYDRNRPFWDNIVFTVGEIVREVVGRYKIHVYGVWFDAIFLDDRVAQGAKKYLDRRGYPVKQKKVLRYIIEPTKSVLPGARITRTYHKKVHKKPKVMDVSYHRNEVDTFEDFLNLVGAVDLTE